LIQLRSGVFTAIPLQQQRWPRSAPRLIQT
jgi:hypothetical protein